MSQVESGMIHISTTGTGNLPRRQKICNRANESGAIISEYTLRPAQSVQTVIAQFDYFQDSTIR